ncbi:D-inositol-3-phosphate glycosyltransferase [compost metagenome]
MTCGSPVIASSTGAIPEIVRDAAILVDPTDDDQLQAALVRVLSSPSLRAELTERGYKQAQAFSWARLARKTLELYEDLINSHENHAANIPPNTRTTKNII